MRIEIHGHQIEVTPALHAYVDTRFARLSRHFEHPMDVIRAQLSIDKPHHRAEATISLSGRTIHADADSQDMYAAIDLLADKLDRLLIKHKEKMVDHHRGESLARAAD